LSEPKLRDDIMKELFNISVGKAASMLSEIVNKRILLSVPDIKIISLEENDFKLDDYLPSTMDGTLMVSSISFEEKLTGRANLIFPAKKMRNFINLCMNKEDLYDSNDMEFSDVDFDIIKEVGNIILNCIIGEVGNFLDINLNYAMPEVKVYKRIDFSQDVESSGFKHVLILYITFAIDETEINGAIVVDLTINSLIGLMEKIDKVEADLND
jgi:Chemotaxis protein CheC, inhibitor of MCP methylation